MKRGLELPVSIPEQLNLATYYLDDNLAAGRGEKVAIYYRDEKYTFHELCAMTNRIGHVLKELEVGLEDRVLLILQDSPEWMAGWFATMKIGGVITHAYTYLKPGEYEYFLNYVRPKVVITDETTLHKVREAARGSRYPKSMLVAGDGKTELKKGEYSLAAMMRSAPPELDAEPTSKDDLAYWNFSGGTTGKSKGVPHMHHDALVGYESMQYVMRYTEEDVVLRVPKLFFHYARDLGMNIPIRAGAAVVLFQEPSSPKLIFDLISRYRPTVLLNVPTMMRAMLQTPQDERGDLSSLRLVVSSGEPLYAQLYREFTETFGVEVINVIGSAESSMAYLMDRPGEVVPGSSGQVMPLVEVKIVDTDGNEVPRGESGVLWVRNEASGWYYHLAHEKSKTTFGGDGWVNTNDLFREDENGYFWYMGRADELIKVSGVYVAPLEVEKCLQEHPAVREVVVLGLEDDDGLVKSKAFIALHEGAEGGDAMADDLQAFCRKKMAPYKAPRAIEFLEELPKTGQGKIDKRQLRTRGL